MLLFCWSCQFLTKQDSAFFESIVGVGTYVGGRSLEEYILPLMVQALTGMNTPCPQHGNLEDLSTMSNYRNADVDSEEFVVEKVLNALTSLAELGLLQKPKLRDLGGVIAPLVCHPNMWVRFGTRTKLFRCVSIVLLRC